MSLGWKFFQLAQTGVSGDPKRDLERADELASRALALDPDWTVNHDLKGDILLGDVVLAGDHEPPLFVRAQTALSAPRAEV
jgi:hypothetical protein